MKLLVLDTCRGGETAKLYVFEENGAQVREMPLGYAPEIHYDRANHRLVVVETELHENGTDRTRYWLKCYDADDLKPQLQTQTPVRPMYSGYPGRSNHVKSSRAGNYLYFLESTVHPEIIDLYRLTVHRYNNETDEIESGSFKVDSCLIDFDQFGENENELCFHLSCEFPSVVALADFDSSELNLIHLENLPSRTHGSKETCGSWLAKDQETLFCINGEGTIYKVNAQSKSPETLTTLELDDEGSIGLQQIYGTDTDLLVGISKDVGERSLSVASEIRQVSAETGETLGRIDLPFPVMNFITTPDNYLIVGVNPYQKAMCLVDIMSGKTLGIRNDMGISPAEVLTIP